ncbi:MAG TPA: DUF4331 domain-containing protein, partial [Streptosporangiaceae bacterium]
FYEFGDDVLYEIHIDTHGNGEADITYQFRFTTVLDDRNTFLYNTGPITSLNSKAWNRKQFYSVTRVDHRGTHHLARALRCPPCNIGPLSTPNYEAALGQPAVHALPGGASVFAGQRAEQFYVDLGSIFDLLDLRPLQSANVFAHSLGLGNQPGVNATNHLNVHTIAIKVPISSLTSHGHPTIGVWTSASRQSASIFGDEGTKVHSGPWKQVSRLANPLFNELIVPLGKKDYWNTQPPAHDKQFAQFVANPELAGLFPAIYPAIGGGAAPFANLAAFNKSGKARADLEAILLTGIPAGIIKGFTNFTGAVQADMLRLNTSIPPTPASAPTFSTLGLVGGDLAGFPNGRRITDDVVTIELRAVAGATLPLVDPAFKADTVVSSVTDG